MGRMSSLRTNSTAHDAYDGPCVAALTETLPPVKRGAVPAKVLRSRKLTTLAMKLVSPRPMLSIACVAGEQGAAVATLLDEAPVRKDSPVFIGAVMPKALDVPADPDTYAAVRLYRVRDVFVTGHSGLLDHGSATLHHERFDPRHHVLGDENFRTLVVDPVKGAVRRLFPDPSPHRLDRAAVFTDALSYNYAHWLTEVLPRIALFARHCAQDGAACLVDADLHANIYRSLDLVLDGRHKVVRVPQDRRVRVDELLYVGCTGYVPMEYRPPRLPAQSQGLFSGEALNQMADWILSRTGASSARSLARKIYVRRNSGVRCLANAEVLEQALLSVGFTIVEPEKLSFDEQVRTFAEADVIVGATGAAFANIVFANKRSRIYVLMAEHAEMPYFYWTRLASCMGLNLQYVLCEQSDRLHKRFHADFVIPPAQMDALIAQVAD